jgi:hypothetical protein
MIIKDFKPAGFSNNKEFIAAYKSGIITIIDITPVNDELVSIYFTNSEASSPEIATRQTFNKAMMIRQGII